MACGCDTSPPGRGRVRQRSFRSMGRDRNYGPGSRGGALGETQGARGGQRAKYTYRHPCRTPRQQLL
eukprot:11159120-Lingulodinium_polyedra.AAC.1